MKTPLELKAIVTNMLNACKVELGGVDIDPKIVEQFLGEQMESKMKQLMGQYLGALRLWETSAAVDIMKEIHNERALAEKAKEQENIIRDEPGVSNEGSKETVLRVPPQTKNRKANRNTRDNAQPPSAS